MEGYQGKILKVDLTEQNTSEEDLSEERAKNFLGGSGLAASFLFDSLSKDLDPLEPDNPLIFMTGPFTGARVPSAGRHAVCAKSPLTGIWGESTSGGFFGTFLKMAGYDGVIITGKAENPVYLSILEGEVSIEDASDYWGKGFYETQEELKKEVRSKRAKVSAIGRAGENLVKYASIMNDHGRAAGRTGMGAVMGSKNLKAIVVDGNETIEIAQPDKLKGRTEEATDIPVTDTTASSNLELFKKQGTMGYLDLGMTLGDTTSKLFQSGIFPTDDIDAVAWREKYHVTSTTCFGCPIGCGKKTEFEERGVQEVDGPEYETTAAFGPLNMNFDLETIIYANHLCNDYGLDTISAGVSIAFASKLYEEGEIEKEQTDIDLEWGDQEAIIDVVEKIAEREGIGDILAEGVKRVAEEFGIPQDRAPHVKGMEVPMHDPRAFTGQAVSYATSPRGACHLKGDYYQIDIGLNVPEAGVKSGNRFESSEEKGAIAARWQNIRELHDSLLLCKFSPIISNSDISKILNAITGWNFDSKEMIKTGERIFNIKRSINWRMGITGQDDKLPDIVTESLSDGATAGRSPDLDALLSGYYNERGWDPETGKPSKEKLEELNLPKAAEELHK